MLAGFHYSFFLFSDIFIFGTKPFLKTTGHLSKRDSHLAWLLTEQCKQPSYMQLTSFILHIPASWTPPVSVSVTLHWPAGTISISLRFASRESFLLFNLLLPFSSLALQLVQPSDMLTILAFFVLLLFASLLLSLFAL